MNRNKNNKYYHLLAGIAMADAQGVSSYFGNEKLSSQFLAEYPQPLSVYAPGTWSESAALSFCLAEALIENGTIETIIQNFLLWYHDGFWTAYGQILVLDKFTKKAMQHLEKSATPFQFSNNLHEKVTANSLASIAPLVFLLQGRPIHKRFEIVQRVSSITNGNILSVIACFYYLEFMLKAMEGQDLQKIYGEFQSSIPDFLQSLFIADEAIHHFQNLFQTNILYRTVDTFKGEDVATILEGIIWCTLSSDSYKQAVLKASCLNNEPGATTTATGALSAMIFGIKGVPAKWKHELARVSDIEDLAERMNGAHELMMRTK